MELHKNSGVAKMMKLYSLLLCLGLVPLLVACINPYHKTAAPEPQFEEIIAPPSQELNERQLQAEIMAFADQFTMVYWQAIDQVRQADLGPETKLAAEYNKLLYISSVMSIAAQPSPDASLLDMVTFIRLGRQAAETYWVPEIYGAAGQPLLSVYERLEREVWQLAALVLNEEQQAALLEMIDRWRSEHPNQWYVSDVRIQDFSTARGRPVHPIATDSRGLLQSIDKTLLRVDETLLVAERAIFLGERMPRLVTLQTELLLEQITDNPLLLQLVNDFSSFQEAGTRMSQAIEQLPHNFAVERKQILDRLSRLLKEERSAWTGEFSAREKNLDELLVRAQKTLEQGSKTAQDYNILVASIKKLGTRDREGGDVLDKSILLAEKTQITARELNLLLENIGRFVSPVDGQEFAPPLQELSAEVMQEQKKLIDRAFRLGIVLILLALTGSLLGALFYRFLAERIFSRKKHEV